MPAELGHREFVDLLPFYVNGSLDDEQRGSIEAYLSSHPKARRELAFQRAVKDQVRQTASSSESRPTLERILRGMGTPRPDRGVPRKYSWLESLKQVWIGNRLAPAFAVIGLMAVLQTAVITGLLMRAAEPYETMRGASVPGHDEAVLQILLRPQATEAELRALFRDVGARVIDGPSDVGFYRLAVALATADAALVRLRASPAVQDVQRLAAQPGN